MDIDAVGLLPVAQPQLVIAFWKRKGPCPDLAEIFLIRGFVFTYEAVRDWEAKLTPILAEILRRKRKGLSGPQLVYG